MTEHLARFLGDGPYPFPLDRPGDMVDFFYSDTVALIVSKTTLDLPALTHSHDSYEFVLPLSVMPKSQIENKVVSFKPERLYPLNSEQSHGAAVEMPGRKLLALQVDKHFLWHIPYSMYRKTRVDFQNDGFALSAHARYLLWLFVTESRNRQAGYKFILESLSIQMIVDVLRRARSNMPGTAIVRNYSPRH
jgi:AraC family transcriptional regulator